MVKIEQILTYGIPLALGGLIVYGWLKQAQAPPTAIAPTAPPIAVPTYTGELPAGAAGLRTDLLSMAEQQLGIPRSELVMRGLRPEDLGLTTSWSFTSTAINTWENWVTATVADNTFIAIEGVAYGGTSFSQIRINAGAATSALWNLNFVAGLQSQLWYSASPIIAQQNQPVVIDVISNAVATETIGLMGTVVERRGMLINP